MEIPSKQDSRLTRAKSIYITTATIWLSTSVMMLFFISACYVYTWIRYPLPAAVLHPYSPHAQASALHSLSRSAAEDLFRDFDRLEVSRMYTYQPWVGFSERTFHSPLLNIDEGEPLSVRRTVQADEATASVRTIWLFGGSTQFGWGVPDNQTIASNLSEILSKGQTHYTVVNHGHTQFYSSQEALLFATLLRHGHKCDIAVFLDGLNDSQTASQDVPILTAGTTAGFLKEEDAAAAENSKYVTITPLFPPVRVLHGLLRRLVPHAYSDVNQRAGGLAATKYDPVAVYLFNISMIRQMAKQENVSVLFYWQPTSFDYITGAEQRRVIISDFASIPSLNLAVRQEIKDSDFHFIADLFKNDPYAEDYVDWGHYGDQGNRKVAQVIANDLKADGFQ